MWVKMSMAVAFMPEVLIRGATSHQKSYGWKQDFIRHCLACHVDGKGKHRDIASHILYFAEQSDDGATFECTFKPTVG